MNGATQAIRSRTSRGQNTTGLCGAVHLSGDGAQPELRAEAERRAVHGRQPVHQRQLRRRRLLRQPDSRDVPGVQPHRQRRDVCRHPRRHPPRRRDSALRLRRAATRARATARAAASSAAANLSCGLAASCSGSMVPAGLRSARAPRAQPDRRGDLRRVRLRHQQHLSHELHVGRALREQHALLHWPPAPRPGAALRRKRQGASCGDRPRVQQHLLHRRCLLL